MSTLNYDKITLNDVPLDVFLKYFNQDTYGDIVNKPSIIPLTAQPYIYNGNEYPLNIKVFFDKYRVNTYGNLYGQKTASEVAQLALADSNWKIAAAYRLFIAEAQRVSFPISTFETDETWYANTSMQRRGDPKQVYLFPLPTSLRRILNPQYPDSLEFGIDVGDWFDSKGRLINNLGDNNRYIPLFNYKTYSQRILFRVKNILSEYRLLERLASTEEEIEKYLSYRDGTYSDGHGNYYSSKKNLVLNSTYFPGFAGFSPYDCTAWLGNTDGSCTKDNNTCAYFLVECRPYQIPEQDENGNNIYIDDTGIKTLKATYANTFITHQDALRRAMSKISSSDGWMNSKPANAMCILRKGDRYQLASYNTIKRTVKYTKVDSSYVLNNLLPNPDSYSNQMIPKRIVDTINSKDSYTVVEDEKVEHLYEYLDEYPRFKCYANYNETYALSTLNPTLIRCSQLDDEVVTPEGFNAILDVYKRYVLFEDGTRIPLNKKDTIKLKLKVDGKYLFGSKFMDIPIFNISGKPFFVLGISATNNEILKLSQKKIEIYVENKTAPIQGQFSKLASQNVTNLKLSIPQLSSKDISFLMGDELGLSDQEIEKLKAYSGDSNYFLKFQSSQEVLETPITQSILVHIRKIIK